MVWVPVKKSFIAVCPFEWDVKVSSKASRSGRFYAGTVTVGVSTLSRGWYTTLPDSTPTPTPDTRRRRG